MTKRSHRAPIPNNIHRRIRWKDDQTDDLPPRRPKYRRDEKPEWRPFECADVDDPLP